MWLHIQASTPLAWALPKAIEEPGKVREHFNAKDESILERNR